MPADPPIPPAPEDEFGATVPARQRDTSREPAPTTRPDGGLDPTMPAVVRTRKTGQSPSGSGRRPTSPNAQGWGKFQLGDELGRGGMGSVRLATDSELQRELAIKLLHDPGRLDAVARFLDEARITGQLEHPNIIPVHELGRDSAGRPWMAMKRVVGTDLAQRIGGWRKARQPLTGDRIREMLEIFGKVCDAVSYAHSRGVIHRDLKPANIMVGSFGEVLVMDWGLARPLDDSGALVPDAADPDAATETVGAGPPPTTGRVTTSRQRAGALTADGAVQGTPAFMPPEQATGDREAIGPAADQFALGGVLYQMLTLESPYAGKSVVEVLAKAANRELLPPRQRSPWRRIPAGLAAVVMRAMAADPRDRYPDIAAMQDDLRRWQANESMVAWRPGLLTRAMRWSRRHPVTSAVGAVSSVALFALAAVVSVWFAQTERLKREASETRAEQIAAEQSRERAERKAREAELLALAQKGEIEQLVGTLGGEVFDQRDRALDALIVQWRDARARGMSDEVFVRRELGPDHLGQYLTAMERLERAAERYPDRIRMTADDWHYYGLLMQWGADDLPNAVRCFTRSLELDPQNGGGLTNRGVVLSELGRYDEALADLNQASRLLPDNARVACMRGYVRQLRGDYHEAIKDQTRAIELDPTLWLAWFNRGSSRLSLGETGPALADLDRAVALQADGMADWRVFSRRGDAMKALGRRVEAIADYTRAIETDPASSQPYAFRAKMHLLENDFEAALADYTDALRRGGDNQYWLLERGVCRHHLNDTEGALADFRRVTQLAPDRHRPFYEMGNQLKKLERYDEAIAAYSAALERYPEYEVCLNNRGSTFMRVGRFEEALRDLDEAIRLEPRKYNSHLNRALALVHLGRRDESAEAFARALALAPDSRRANVEQLRRKYLGG